MFAPPQPFRLVETGHDATGKAVIRFDGRAARTIDVPGGIGVTEMLWLDGPARTAADGRVRDDEGFPLEPPPGGLSFRIMRFPAGTFHEMHTTDTLDYVVVIEGQIALGLDDGEHVLNAGDVVIQRRTRHSWRVVGAAPCSIGVLMMRPTAGESAPAPVALQPPSVLAGDGGGRVRRVVTATDASDKSFVLSDGVPSLVFEPSGSGGVSIVDLWQTGGALVSCEQGGDAAKWELDPLGSGGVSCRTSQLPAGMEVGDRGWHATPTIDFDVVLSGHVELALPDGITTVIGPGETVLQRGTNHRWRPVGDEPVRWFAIMIGLHD